MRKLMRLADPRDQSYMAVEVIANKHWDAITRKIAELHVLAGELDALINFYSRNIMAGCRSTEVLRPDRLDHVGKG